MKRLLSIIMLIVCVLAKADAQYYSVNYDRQTVAAMAAAYGTEAVAEAYYNEQVQNILKHYNAAEVASAGIYASKFLERKAMTELGIWNKHRELLLPPYLQHGVGQNHAEDMDGSRHDAEKSADCPLLGKLSREDM